jgi:hypothetical protein
MTAYNYDVYPSEVGGKWSFSDFTIDGTQLVPGNTVTVTFHVPTGGDDCWFSWNWKDQFFADYPITMPSSGHPSRDGAAGTAVVFTISNGSSGDHRLTLSAKQQFKAPLLVVAEEEQPHHHHHRHEHHENPLRITSPTGGSGGIHVG